MRISIPLLALFLSLASAPAFSETEATDQAEEAGFSLEAQEGDGPDLARLKAALRLLKSAQATDKALQICAPTAPAAGQALNGFRARNGNTLALVLNVIKRQGGLTPDIKALMDREVAAEAAALQATDCQGLAKQVVNQNRDLYRAAALASDYKIVKESR